MIMVSLLLFHWKPTRRAPDKDDVRNISTHIALSIFALEIDSNDEEINDFDAETIARAFQHLSRPANEGGPRIFIG